MRRRHRMQLRAGWIAMPVLLILLAATGCAGKPLAVVEPTTMAAALVPPAPVPAVEEPVVAAEPVAPEPARPTPADPETIRIRERLLQVVELADTTRSRELTHEQSEQLEAVDGFVLLARQALTGDDRRRAATITDKASILIEELERASR